MCRVLLRRPAISHLHLHLQQLQVQVSPDDPSLQHCRDYRI
jgi:hypothetical protein